MILFMFYREKAKIRMLLRVAVQTGKCHYVFAPGELLKLLALRVLFCFGGVGSF